MDTSEYLGLFLDESRESLQALNASLLDLERDPSDAEPLTVIFRVAHSLKGMSATMGFEAMARLTHRMETVLASLRDDGAAVTPAISDSLFACLDTLQEMVDRIAAEDTREVDASAVLARLDGIAEGSAAPAAAAAEVAATLAPPAPDETLSDYDRMVVADAQERGMVVLRVAVTFEEGCQLAAARAFMVVQELEGAGDLIKSDPPAESIEAGEVEGGVVFWVAAEAGADAEEIRAGALGVSEVASCSVEPVAAPAPAGDAPAPVAAEAPEAAEAAEAPAPERASAAAEHRPARGVSTVRVGTDRLDALMNLMGEMVIQRTRLAQLSAQHGLVDLRSAVEDMTRVTNDLQSLIMQVRMMPVEAVFMRFPRMVRDLANTLGKRLDLQISGEDTELDRTVIDGLGDPLVHMLRNAVDHGLESPEEREAAGKDPVGTIQLSARHAGNSVVIEVRDDGRGMDPDALREIGNIGAGTAATALSEMTGSPVQMGVPVVTLLPVEEIGDRTGAPDRVVAAMFLGVHGDAPGHMLFVMDEAAARAVVNVLMGGMDQPAGEGAHFTALELSALQEVGNILTGSYLNALSQITGLRLEPTPPAVGVDLAGALLGATLAEIAMGSDTAIPIESALGDADTPSVGDFLFVPTTEALAVVLDRLGLGG